MKLQLMVSDKEIVKCDQIIVFGTSKICEETSEEAFDKIHKCQERIALMLAMLDNTGVMVKGNRISVYPEYSSKKVMNGKNESEFTLSNVLSGYCGACYVQVLFDLRYVKNYDVIAECIHGLTEENASVTYNFALSDWERKRKEREIRKRLVKNALDLADDFCESQKWEIENICYHCDYDNGYGNSFASSERMMSKRSGSSNEGFDACAFSKTVMDNIPEVTVSDSAKFFLR